MSQLILPVIPEGASEISGLLSIWRDEYKWTYFMGCMPIYSHRSDDQRMFRIVTSQLIESDTCRELDIVKTFGVSKSSVDRSLKKPRHFWIKVIHAEMPQMSSGYAMTHYARQSTTDVSGNPITAQLPQRNHLEMWRMHRPPVAQARPAQQSCLRNKAACATKWRT